MKVKLEEEQAEQFVELLEDLMKANIRYAAADKEWDSGHDVDAARAAMVEFLTA